MRVCFRSMQAKVATGDKSAYTLTALVQCAPLLTYSGGWGGTSTVVANLLTMAIPSAAYVDTSDRCQLLGLASHSDALPQRRSQWLSISPHLSWLNTDVNLPVLQVHSTIVSQYQKIRGHLQKLPLPALQDGHTSRSLLTASRSAAQLVQST